MTDATTTAHTDPTITTRITFTLPVGYETDDGQRYREVTMRKVKNKDIIAVQNDIEMKKLSHEKLELRDNHNPITAMAANGMLAKMFSILFCQVVLEIKGIENVTKAIFLDMYNQDLNYMIEQYGELNGIDVDKVKLMEGDNPLGFGNDLTS